MHRNHRRSISRFGALLSVVFGVVIILKPSVLAYLIGAYLIIKGILEVL